MGLLMMNLSMVGLCWEKAIIFQKHSFRVYAESCFRSSSTITMVLNLRERVGGENIEFSFRMSLIELNLGSLSMDNDNKLIFYIINISICWLNGIEVLLMNLLIAATKHVLPLAWSLVKVNFFIFVFKLSLSWILGKICEKFAYSLVLILWIYEFSHVAGHLHQSIILVGETHHHKLRLFQIYPLLVFHF